DSRLHGNAPPLFHQRAGEDIMDARLAMLRITGGTARGRILRGPRRATLRPTKGMVKEALFSMLASLAPSLGRVLDLYAGVGALGIEALSRGADWVDFAESDREACALIRQNLATTGFSDQSKVFCVSAKKSLSILPERYDIILLDPPYSGEEVDMILRALGESRLVQEGTLVAAEHSSRRELAQEYGRLTLVKTRRYGESSLSIFRQEVMS
ncbi:MAG: 16S rRNA (guanine(966)-N(2))-methyltransferase RsmD, partial [Dehalococcoidia bacterium]|nr:16S rRNA (guanine(966)-N(2))-methyltransferase RsmD [Dehalococcoidia bacterium]